MQLKDVLHYYLGCEVKHQSFKSNLIFCGITDRGSCRLRGKYDETGYNANTDNFKPILRRLSSMTEEEKDNVSEILGAISADHFLEAVKNNSKYLITIEHSFELTHYLLSKHFDLFSLIESGQAIDRDTLTNK